MIDVIKIYKTILLYPQSKGKLVVFGWVGAQTQFPQKNLHFNYISLHITSSFQYTFGADYLYLLLASIYLMLADGSKKARPVAL